MGKHSNQNTGMKQKLCKIVYEIQNYFDYVIHRNSDEEDLDFTRIKVKLPDYFEDLEIDKSPPMYINKKAIAFLTSLVVFLTSTNLEVFALNDSINTGGGTSASTGTGQPLGVPSSGGKGFSTVGRAYKVGLVEYDLGGESKENKGDGTLKDSLEANPGKYATSTGGLFFYDQAYKPYMDTIVRTMYYSNGQFIAAETDREDIKEKSFMLSSGVSENPLGKIEFGDDGSMTATGLLGEVTYTDGYRPEDPSKIFFSERQWRERLTSEEAEVYGITDTSKSSPQSRSAFLAEFMKQIQENDDNTIRTKLIENPALIDIISAQNAQQVFSFLLSDPSMGNFSDIFGSGEKKTYDPANEDSMNELIEDASKQVLFFALVHALCKQGASPEVATTIFQNMLATLNSGDKRGALLVEAMSIGRNFTGNEGNATSMFPTIDMAEYLYQADSDTSLRTNRPYVTEWKSLGNMLEDTVMYCIDADKFKMPSMTKEPKSIGWWQNIFPSQGVAASGAHFLQGWVVDPDTKQIKAWGGQLWNMGSSQVTQVSYLSEYVGGATGVYGQFLADFQLNIKSSPIAVPPPPLYFSVKSTPDAHQESGDSINTPAKVGIYVQDSRYTGINDGFRDWLESNGKDGSSIEFRIRMWADNTSDWTKDSTHTLAVNVSKEQLLDCLNNGVPIVEEVDSTVIGKKFQELPTNSTTGAKEYEGIYINYTAEGRFNMTGIKKTSQKDSEGNFIYEDVQYTSFDPEQQIPYYDDPDNNPLKNNTQFIPMEMCDAVTPKGLGAKQRLDNPHYWQQHNGNPVYCKNPSALPKDHTDADDICTDRNQASWVTSKVEDPPVANRIIHHYRSFPNMYAEVKEGSPESHTWEAMGGSPTTASIYYATGGSEFIIDIELEYIPECIAKRTYQLRHSLPCPHNGHGYTHVHGKGCPGIYHACKNHTLGQSDAWTQYSQFEYMKINSCEVWRINGTTLENMDTLKINGTSNKQLAPNSSGMPDIKLHIAEEEWKEEEGNNVLVNGYECGRLIYSLTEKDIFKLAYNSEWGSLMLTDTSTEDNVILAGKTDTDCAEGQDDVGDLTEHNSAFEGDILEYKAWNEVRKAENQVKAISDYLVLYTDQGDKCVYYFESDWSEPKPTAAQVWDRVWDINSMSIVWKLTETPEKLNLYTFDYNNKVPKAYEENTLVVERKGDTALWNDNPFVNQTFMRYKSGAGETELDGKNDYGHIPCYGFNGQFGKPGNTSGMKPDKKAQNYWYLDETASTGGQKAGSTVPENSMFFTAFEKMKILGYTLSEKVKPLTDIKRPTERLKIEWRDWWYDLTNANGQYDKYNSKTTYQYIIGDTSIVPNVINGIREKDSKSEFPSWYKSKLGNEVVYTVRNRNDCADYDRKLIEAKYGSGYGFTETTPYSDSRAGGGGLDKINAIVIHNPVSVQATYVVSRPEEYDQRTLYTEKYHTHMDIADKCPNDSTCIYKTVKDPCDYELNGGTMNHDLGCYAGIYIDDKTIVHRHTLACIQNCVDKNGNPITSKYEGLENGLWEWQSTIKCTGIANVVTPGEWVHGLNRQWVHQFKVEGTNLNDVCPYCNRTITEIQNDPDAKVDIQYGSDGSSVFIGYMHICPQVHITAWHEPNSENCGCEGTCIYAGIQAYCTQCAPDIEDATPTQITKARNGSIGEFETLIKHPTTTKQLCDYKGCSMPTLGHLNRLTEAGMVSKHVHIKGVCTSEDFSCFPWESEESMTIKAGYLNATKRGYYAESGVFVYIDANLDEAGVLQILNDNIKAPCGNIHHDGNHFTSCYVPCNDDNKHAQGSASVSTPTGDYNKGFINLDYPFTVKFPNIGYFNKETGHGISNTQYNEQYGLWDTNNAGNSGVPYDKEVDNGQIVNAYWMDTSPYIKAKTVTFPFAVMIDANGDGSFENDYGKVIPAGTEILLAINKTYLTNDWHGQDLSGGKMFKDLSHLNLLGNWESYADTSTDEYNFYCVLGNSEALKAETVFKVYAINSSSDDGNSSTSNIERNGATRGTSRYAAYHTAQKRHYIDVVGRIGAMIVEDTDDFRFSNFFKQPKDGWFIEHVVKKVDTSLQRALVQDNSQDLRGMVGTDTSLHASGVRGFLPYPEGVNHDVHVSNTNLRRIEKNDTEATGSKDRLASLPLQGSVNNIKILQDQDMLIGYDAYMSFKTIGNYMDKAQIVPYYYLVDTKEEKIIPANIFMKTQEKGYQIINQFDAVTTGWNPKSVYSNYINLNWEAEAKRRNYNVKDLVAPDSKVFETNITNLLAETVSQNKYINAGKDENGKTIYTYESVPLIIPEGMYHYFGTNQILDLDEGNRTFVGSRYTFSEQGKEGSGNLDIYDRNPGNILADTAYYMHSQRWHFTLGLPSSAIALPVKGDDGNTVLPNTKTIAYYKHSRFKLIVAIQIRVLGEIFALQYQAPHIQTIKVGNKIYDFGNNDYNELTPLNPNPSVEKIGGKYPPYVVMIFDCGKSSDYDLESVGTH